MIPEECRQAARKIGSFYLQKHKGDYAAAAKEIDSLRITEVRVEYSYSSKPTGGTPSVVIVSGRVGLLVGRRGSNIDELSKYFAPTKIKILEDQDPLSDWLIPTKPEEDYDAR